MPATPWFGCQKDHVGWVKAQFYVLNFQLEILEWFFLVFFFSSYQHTKIGFGTKYRSVTSAYISLSFSEVENDPFSNSFSIELSVWSCSARTPFFCASNFERMGKTSN